MQAIEHGKAWHKIATESYADTITRFSSENIEQHIAAHTAGDLTPTLKSAEEPEQDDAKPYELVGKTFDNFVKENEKIVVLTGMTYIKY